MLQWYPTPDALLDAITHGLRSKSIRAAAGEAAMGVTRRNCIATLDGHVAVTVVMAMSKRKDVHAVVRGDAAKTQKLYGEVMARVMGFVTPVLKGDPGEALRAQFDEFTATGRNMAGGDRPAAADCHPELVPNREDVVRFMAQKLFAAARRYLATKMHEPPPALHDADDLVAFLSRRWQVPTALALLGVADFINSEALVDTEVTSRLLADPRFHTTPEERLRYMISQMRSEAGGPGMEDADAVERAWCDEW